MKLIANHLKENHQILFEFNLYFYFYFIIQKKKWRVHVFVHMTPRDS